MAQPKVTRSNALRKYSTLGSNRIHSQRRPVGISESESRPDTGGHQYGRYMIRCPPVSAFLAHVYFVEACLR